MQKEIELNGEKYVLKSSFKNSPKAKELEGMKYVIVRTHSAGVFACYLESRDGKEGVLRQARRIHYWEGAASLSQLAMEGVKEPDECRFPCEVDKITVTEIIEILECTEAARLNIKNVPVWEA